MDYISIIAIGTLVSSFFSGFVLGKVLEIGLLAQLFLGTSFLFIIISVIDIVITFTGYEF